MSKRMFTKEQIKVLSENTNVSKCSNKAITYSPEFKLRAIKRYYDEGLTPVQIFIEAEFDLAIIGRKTPKDRMREWRKIYNRKGEAGLLNDNRGKQASGRPTTKDLTNEEKIERLEATVAYLKAENDFLVKLRAAKKE